MLPKEKNLEESIENYLISAGYEQGYSQEFDLQYCLFTRDLFRFLEATQKDLLDEFKSNRGSNWKKSFLDLVSLKTNLQDRIIIEQYGEMFKQDKNIMDIAKTNSYKDLVSAFAKSYFKRGIVK